MFKDLARATKSMFGISQVVKADIQVAGLAVNSLRRRIKWKGQHACSDVQKSMSRNGAGPEGQTLPGWTRSGRTQADLALPSPSRRRVCCRDIPEQTVAHLT